MDPGGRGGHSPDARDIWFWRITPGARPRAAPVASSPDSAGAFTLHAPSTGVYWLRALPPGHAPVLSRPFVLERGDSLALPLRALEVYMQPEFVPPQLSMAPFNSCGAVALWTHHGLGIE